MSLLSHSIKITISSGEAAASDESRRSESFLLWHCLFPSDKLDQGWYFCHSLIVFMRAWQYSVWQLNPAVLHTVYVFKSNATKGICCITLCLERVGRSYYKLSLLAFVVQPHSVCVIFRSFKQRTYRSSVNCWPVLSCCSDIARLNMKQVLVFGLLCTKTREREKKRSCASVNSTKSAARTSQACLSPALFKLCQTTVRILQQC